MRELSYRRSVASSQSGLTHREIVPAQCKNGAKYSPPSARSPSYNDMSHNTKDFASQSQLLGSQDPTSLIQAFVIIILSCMKPHKFLTNFLSNEKIRPLHIGLILEF